MVLDETCTAPCGSEARIPAVSTSPNVTDSTAGSSASIEMTTSPVQASATVVTAVAPRSTSAAAFSGDLLYAVTS